MSDFGEIDVNRLRLDPAEDIDIGNCAKCPRIMHCIDAVRIEHAEAKAVLDGIVNTDSSEFVLNAYDEAKASGFVAILEQVGKTEITDGESLMGALRQMALTQSDKVDNTIEEAKLGIEAMTSDCEGPLRMRTTKVGRVVTATICNSPQAYSGFACEDVHIERRLDLPS